MQDAWSDKTLHESFRSPPGANLPISRGQCGVTSAWLVEVLESFHPTLQIAYCYGDVHAADESASVLERHCWVEIGERDDPQRLIIDLTGDQWTVLRDHEVLCQSYDWLRHELRVDYQAKYARLSSEELKLDLVQTRLTILKDHLAAER